AGVDGLLGGGGGEFAFFAGLPHPRQEFLRWVEGVASGSDVVAEPLCDDRVDVGGAPGCGADEAEERLVGGDVAFGGDLLCHGPCLLDVPVCAFVPAAGSVPGVVGVVAGAVGAHAAVEVAGGAAGRVGGHGVIVARLGRVIFRTW